MLVVSSRPSPVNLVENGKHSADLKTTQRFPERSGIHGDIVALQLLAEGPQLGERQRARKDRVEAQRELAGQRHVELAEPDVDVALADILS